MVVPKTQSKAEKQDRNLLVRAGTCLKRQTGNQPVAVEYIEEAMKVMVNQNLPTVQFEDQVAAYYM